MAWKGARGEETEDDQIAESTLTSLPELAKLSSFTGGKRGASPAANGPSAKQHDLAVPLRGRQGEIHGSRFRLGR